MGGVGMGSSNGKELTSSAQASVVLFDVGGFWCLLGGWWLLRVLVGVWLYLRHVLVRVEELLADGVMLSVLRACRLALSISSS